ncbi:hypothetical protein AWRI1631_30270 [Saccharomyces cerevisiae AWRI1631]|uniref:Uncharacterized protein n=1 Tax=Saccharomyces cerevisiae (strain AWRI1631) TaxID=545124 RepID=B5VER9_YEAS6|nr:hypothetical protein AWRI1631_30270 [Saccharomyces cerevisiae AWRI1631]
MYSLKESVANLTTAESSGATASCWAKTEEASSREDHDRTAPAENFITG